VDPARIDPGLFRNLPPDDDVVAPIGSAEERIYRDEQIQVQCIGDSLRSWGPAQVADPVQRARNFLYVAAVPDVLQLTIERWVPAVVFTHMRADFVRGDLVRSLYWIATHPDEGSIPSLRDLRRVCLDVGGTEDRAAYRERIRIYALKLLGRLTGAIPEG
jgi:hypothetical protein